jgi:DNA repair exonuclease SbcCD nuclease subunit
MVQLFKTNKVACISDIHLGVHQNAATWHEIALNFAKWLDQELKLRDIKDIIIAGDVFHNRHEIGVTTIHCAHDFFNILNKYNIFIVCGNHDAYFKNKSDINSISILNKPGITVFDKLTTKQHLDKVFSFCPWGVPVEEIPPCDVVIGHFEILNFKMNAHKVCDHGVESESLLDKTKLVITGHFHCRDHRKYKNNKSIIYLGSPHELDFGDRDQVKGFTILDTDDLSLELVENNVTPKHKKLKISELLDGKIALENISEELQNNFVSLCVDRNVNEQILNLMLSKFNQYKPKHVRTDFNIFESVQLSATELNEVSIDIDTALHEFVNLLDTPVPKKDILDKCIDLYRISQTVNEH